MIVFKRKPPYSQMEISEQIGHISELMKQRRSSQLTEEIKRFDTAVETSQEVLAFMMDEIRHFQDKK